MLYFNCDYTEGAHPRILERMLNTNMEQTVGYGEDQYCEQARELIRKECGREDVAVHFLVGGTQANFTVIRSALRPHQGAISAVTGHINAHETGAVEATGHKVLALPSGSDGKLTAAQVEETVKNHWSDETHEHQVQPKMVYISHPTENGALYTLAELEALSKTCKENGLYLFLDGARLGYGLTARGTDVTMADLARLCDVFYIGGTKCGALFGEAVVIVNPELKTDFRYAIKQNGGMLAKGRLLGIQFLTLFEDRLYYQICRTANQQAYRIADACKEAGFPFFAESITNQQFPIFPNRLLEKLGQKYAYSTWAKVDEDHTAIRLATSWATREEAVEQLIADIQELGKEL
ncbi:putative threonine aldolase [Clostridium sp. CAG:1013]|nr:putative threonine aldolase [Clostridium sp. CAG:1013]